MTDDCGCVITLRRVTHGHGDAGIIHRRVQTPQGDSENFYNCVKQKRKYRTLVSYALAAYGGNAEAAQNDAGRVLMTSAFRPSEITLRGVRKPTDGSNTI